MTNNQQSDALLRTLDAASPGPGTRSATLGARARDDLATILASPRDATLHHEPATRRGGRTPSRLVLASGLVAASVAGVLVLPSLVGGADTAFASWTAVPGALSPAEQRAAADGCRDTLADTGQDQTVLTSATTAVSESRGAWTTVVLAGPGGWSGLCVTDQSAPVLRQVFDRDVVGSAGTPTGWTPPDRGAVVATDLGVATMDAGNLSVVAGEVGDDVTAVAFRSRDRGLVEATVAGGRFVLWWPGEELADVRDVEVEVTHADGSTAAVTLSL